MGARAAGKLVSSPMPKQSPSLITFTRTNSTFVLQLATEADGVDVVLLTSVQLPASVTS